jgi:hypothetical protein
MREEPPQSFPLPNDAELTHVYIESELKKAGINLQRISVDDKVITITTDKKIPKKTMSNIREDAAYHGFTTKFLTSG